jgi:putative nucleotidyltransferase with HDIG domain
MLKKIAVKDLRLGMHLHSLEGAWLSHPFWKTKFVLDDSQDLVKVVQSGIEYCWIDVSKGQDVAGARPSAAGSVSEPKVKVELQAPAVAESADRPTAMGEEVKRAAALVSKSKQAVTALFSEARMGKALNAENCLPLVDEIASSVSRNPQALIGLARLKTHDDYTYMHSVAVCALMVSLAKQLHMDESQARTAGLAGLLHDIGKTFMPTEVLNKPGKLTDIEFDVIKTHPARGYAALLQGNGVPEAAMDVCLHHHERVDGKGYPHGLKDDQISLFAKMGAVCDVYDAITSNRPYKSGWDPAESVRKMAEWRPGHFDEGVFQAFVKSLGIYPVGSLVRMQSSRLAVVVAQNEHSLVAPIVKVFFSTRSQMQIPPEILDLSQPHCSDRIAERESNAEWKFTHLDELWAGKDNLRRIGIK